MDGQICEDCEQAPASKSRYGGFEWHPICDGCAEWWPEHRLGPLHRPGNPHFPGSANAQWWDLANALSELGEKAFFDIAGGALDALTFLWRIRWPIGLLLVALFVIEHT